MFLNFDENSYPDVEDIVLKRYITMNLLDGVYMMEHRVQIRLEHGQLNEIIGFINQN